MTLPFRLLMLGAAGTLGLSACTAPATTPSQSSPHVVAAFYPLEWAASSVLGDHGSVSTLTVPGAEAHDVELTAQQIASLTDSDLVIHLDGFQPAVDDAITQAGAVSVLDAATFVDLLPIEEDKHAGEEDKHAGEEDKHAGEEDKHAGEEDKHAGEEQAHAAEEDKHAGEEDKHDHGYMDPHFWQDPTRMAVLVEEVGRRLAEIDPDNAADYKANAERTAAELLELDAELKAGLDNCVRREFISTHAAFRYLAERYNLTEIGISGVNPDAEPSPARIAEIHMKAREYGLTTIFFETLTSDAVAASIAGDLDLATAVLDPLEGVTENSPATDYPSIMRANLSALAAANECS